MAGGGRLLERPGHGSPYPSTTATWCGAYAVPVGASIDRLVAVAGPPCGAAAPAALHGGRLVQELAGLLSRRNGFYAFESALHVLPSDPAAGRHGIQGWNDHGLWRDAYGDLAEGHLFFAEDIFGVQFSVRDDAVWSFDPETGGAEEMASSIEGWAALLLADYEMLTGFPLAHEWQEANGPLPPGSRLVPTVPFVLGGEFSVRNLHLLDAVTGMRLRADIALQIRDLPDGAQVRLHVDEGP